MKRLEEMACEIFIVRTYSFAEQWLDRELDSKLKNIRSLEYSRKGAAYKVCI